MSTELRGRCGWCRTEHSRPNDSALAETELRRLFDELARAPELARERALLEVSRGKMIGILIGRAPDGSLVISKAYSGDLGGPSDWPGWAPSINRREDTAELEAETLAELARIEAELLTASTEERVALRRSRREASATLMAAMIDATRLTNAGGRTEPLRRVFAGDGIPSGTATCVLPKLLMAANVAGVQPIGVAEAWWGPRYGERRHGVLGAPCVGRCLPILGFLMCTDGAPP